MQLLPEWTFQTTILMVWPHKHSAWAPRLAAIEATYFSMANAIAEQQSLTIICYDEAVKKSIQKQLPQQNITYLIIPTNDTWIRDFGPLSLSDGTQQQLLNCQFNGWGNKYPHHLDNQVNEHLYELKALSPCYMRTAHIILEGGSIDTDGNGTVITTTHCNRNPNRRFKMDKTTISEHLKTLLGANSIFWLKEGLLEGDDTDGHVDTLARFCDEKTIAYAACENNSDSHHDSLRAMEEELQNFKNKAGENYHLIPLPIPQPLYNDQGERLPATYANFQILNESVLVPTYDDPMDAVVMERLASAFPQRRLIAIDSRVLLQEGGMIHCALMQITV
ncbi:MAG: agmatine deiminase family protein [Gammaproteobacteria bacterium]